MAVSYFPENKKSCHKGELVLLNNSPRSSTFTLLFFGNSIKSQADFLEPVKDILPFLMFHIRLSTLPQL